VFDVYRKATSTQRYITVDYFHPQSHKNAAFHSMTHRMCNFKLSDENYKKEKKSILEIRQIYRYSNNNILKIIHKHEETARRENLSNFYNSANQNPITKRISVKFFPAITNGIKKVFKQHKIDLVTTSSGYKLKKSTPFN
jgi:hypothetical protein